MTSATRSTCASVMPGNSGSVTAPAKYRSATGKALGEYEDFVTGFITSDGQVWGRPVGIAVAKDGSLLISEDGNGTIWRVSYLREN